VVTVDNLVAQANGRIVPSAENAPTIVSRTTQLAHTD
jgi:hypothetical protein